MNNHNNIEWVSDNSTLEVKKNMDMKVAIPIYEFGDASVDDVAAGKTFTSSNGLRLTGSANKCGVSVSTITIPAGRLLGDVNFDGIIDEQDIDLVTDYVMGRIQLTGDDLRAADANDSGVVDTTDVNSVFDIVNFTKYKVGLKTIDFLNDLNRWQKREDFNDQQEYPWIFSITVDVPGIKPTSIVKITPMNFMLLKNCGMSSTVTLNEDSITFYTLRPPVSNVECMLEILGDGEGTSMLVVASDASFRPKPEEIGAAKCEIISLILKTSKWEGNGPYDYYIENKRIKDRSVGIIGVVGSSSVYETAKAAQMVVKGSSDGLLYLSAMGVKPTENIRCQLIIFADNGGEIMGCFPS